MNEKLENQTKELKKLVTKIKRTKKPEEKTKLFEKSKKLLGEINNAVESAIIDMTKSGINDILSHRP